MTGSSTKDAITNARARTPVTFAHCKRSYRKKGPERPWIHTIFPGSVPDMNFAQGPEFRGIIC